MLSFNLMRYDSYCSYQFEISSSENIKFLILINMKFIATFLDSVAEGYASISSSEFYESMYSSSLRKFTFYDF